MSEAEALSLIIEWSGFGAADVARDPRAAWEAAIRRAHRSDRGGTFFALKAAGRILEIEAVAG